MHINQHITTKSGQETMDFGARFAQLLLGLGAGDTATTLCLYGELGSGKTTFVQGFAKGLGIESRLLSPTFIIVRRYPLVSSDTGFLYHLDLYRLQTDDELEELGLSEMFADSGSFVVIEWAEKLGLKLPDHRIDIHFTVTPEGSHDIVVTKI